MSIRTLLLPALSPLLFAAACGTTDVTAPKPVKVPPPSATPVSAPAPTASAPPAVPDGICTRFLAQNREVLARGEGAESQGTSESVTVSESCFVSPKGAWGLRLDRWENKDQPGSGDQSFTFEGHFTVVHLPEGSAATETPKGFGDLARGFVTTVIEKPVLFDYDGDGEPEIFQVVQTHVHEDASSTQSALYTWKNGAVKLYPGLPAHVTASQDVDHDGRPDFLYYPYMEERESACSGFGFRWLGPEHLVHSLPGGAFSLDDKLAQDHLLAHCPAPPKGKIKPDHKALCESCTDSDCNLCTGIPQPSEVCARVHGASEKEARALLGRLCKKPKIPQDECQIPAGVCGDYKEREKVLAKITPLAGRPPATPAPPSHP